MTSERQAETQRALMTMLGDRSQPGAPEPPKPKKSRSVKLSSDATPPPIPPAAVVMPPAPPSEESAGATGDVNSANDAKQVADPAYQHQHHYVSDPELDKWACTLCTLLNMYSSECCVACETARPW
jgi:hypothetical protein